jgi:hypothetical protein
MFLIEAMARQFWTHCPQGDTTPGCQIEYDSSGNGIIGGNLLNFFSYGEGIMGFISSYGDVLAGTPNLVTNAENYVRYVQLQLNYQVAMKYVDWILHPKAHGYPQWESGTRSDRPQDFFNTKSTSPTWWVNWAGDFGNVMFNDKPYDANLSYDDPHKMVFSSGPASDNEIYVIFTHPQALPVCQYLSCVNVVQKPDWIK